MHALSRYLTDFTAPPQADAFAAQRRNTPAAAAPGPAVDVDALARDAAESARAEGEAAVRAEYEQLLEAQLAGFQQQAAEERLRWAVEEGERLATRMDEAVEALKAEIAERLARIVLPFIAAGVRERALTDLHALVEALLAADQSPKITVSGPADLIAQIKARLSAADGVGFAVAATTDVTVIAGETVLQTEMQAWATWLATAAPGGAHG